MITVDNAALDAISAEAERGAPPPPGGAPSSPAAATVDRAAEVRGWAAIPKAFGSILSMAMPELAEAYSDEACTAWGDAMTDVAARHGWSAAIVGPYLGLALVSLPMAQATYFAIRMRRDPAFAEALRAMRAAQAGAEAPPTPQARPSPEPASAASREPVTFENGQVVSEVQKVKPLEA